MALEPEELDKIIEAIARGFDKASASRPDSKKEYDVIFRTTGERLKVLSEKINSTTKGTAENAEAQRLFVRTLKGKVDEISNSFGTFEEKLAKVDKELENLTGVTDKYKEQVKKAAEAQIKNTEANKIQSEKTEELSKRIETVNKAFAPLGGLVGGIAKSYQSGGSAISAAGGLLSTSVGFAATTAQQAGAGLLSVGAAASMLPGAFRIAGIAAMFAGGGLQLFGSGLSAVATKVLPFLTTEADNAVNGFRGISSTGAIFTDGVAGMAKAGGQAGLLLNEFSDTIKANASNIAESGLSITEGSKKIGAAFEADRKAGGVMRETLNRLGYSYQEQAGLLAETMGQMRRLGARPTDDQVSEQTKKYAENLRIIANITGEDAKSKLKQVEKQNMIAAFQAELSKRSPEQQAEINAAMASGMSDMQQQALRERVMNNGRLMTQETSIYESQNAAARAKGEKMYELYQKNELTAKKSVEVAGQFQNAISENAKNQEKMNFAGAALGGVYQKQADANLQDFTTMQQRLGDKKKIEDIIADAAKVKADAEKAAADKAKGIAPKDLTGQLLGIEDQFRQFRMKMQETILSGDILGKFAKSVTDVTKTITGLISEYGGTAGSITGSIIEGIGSFTDTLLKYGFEILGMVAAYKAVKSFFPSKMSGPPGPTSGTPPKGPTPGGPTPGSPGGLTQNAKGQWQRSNGQFATKAEIAEHLNPKTPTPEPPAKTGIKGRLSNIASKGAGVLESVLGNKAGVAGIFSAISGDIGGVIESAKELVSGASAKIAGAGTTEAAGTKTPKATETINPKVTEAAGTKAATDAAEKIGAKSAAEAGAKLATTVGAKALTAMKGVGAILATETLGYAGGKLKESGHEKLGAAADIASETAQMASLGAMIGSIVPGIGTAIGAGVGAAAGGAYGLYKNYDSLFGKKSETPAKVEDKTKPAEKTPEKVETIQKNIEQITIQTALIKSAIIDSITLKEKKAETTAPAKIEDKAKPTENKTTVQPVPVVPTPGAALPKELDNTNPSNPNYVKPDNSSIPKTALEIKNDLVKEIAGKMGIKNTDNLTSTMQGGVPTSINGTPVPTNLYSEEQLKSISLATQAQNLIQGKVDTKTLSPMVAPNNPVLTNNTTSMAQQYATEIEENKKALNAKTQDQTIKTTNEPTTNQVLASLSKEIGKMAVALEEMVDYTRATASNTRNTYHAVS